MDSLLTWKTRSMKMRTKLTWTTMTTNWATTWASITSRLVTPAIQDLSSSPSFLSMMKLMEVRPTAMK